ncbi:hypothetical protein AVEN_1236-1 [Araneus ventricosus]|uniref:C2H2-type domain-containing protein n=1 Tax=Araneus ventricosus TaxID=182803 RepID=A0A4Y2K583_ARAVE|nr:hypothetical protein AVEN_1236-1 [Araneus ventricosus]
MRLKVEIRFLWAKRCNCTEIYRELCEVYGENAMPPQTIVKWCNMLENGLTDDDAEREGRPSTATNSDISSRVNESILANGRVAVDEVANKLDISHGTDDNQLYSCTLCDETFTLPSSLKKHERLRHATNNHSFFKCKRTFENSDGLKRHIVLYDDDNDGNSRNKQQRQSSSPQPGPSCLQSGVGSPIRRSRTAPPQPGPYCLQSGVGGPIRRSRTALNTIEVVKIFPRATVLKDLELFLIECEKKTMEHLYQKSREERGIKFYLNIKVRFVRYITETEKEYLETHFRSKCETCLFD